MQTKSPTLRFVDWFFELQLAISMAALVVMMLVTVVDVIMRYLFNSPVRGSYDIVEVCLVVSVFFALASVTAQKQHIAIDLIDNMVPRGVVKILIGFANLAIAVLLLFLVYAMLKPAGDAYSYGDVKLELDLPVWIIWVFAIFGVLNGALAALTVFMRPDALAQTEKTEVL